MEEKNLSGLSIHVSEGCLVAPVQGDIDDERMKSIQEQVLESVKKTGIKGVVIDLSGVRILEPYYAEIIDRTAKMLNLLGAKTVLSGINPGVAISLSDSHFEFEEIFETARTFEDGVEKLQSVIAVGEEIEVGETEVEVEETEMEGEEGEEEVDEGEIEVEDRFEGEEEWDEEESSEEEEAQDFD